MSFNHLFSQVYCKWKKVSSFQSLFLLHLHCQCHQKRETLKNELGPPRKNEGNKSKSNLSIFQEFPSTYIGYKWCPEVEKRQGRRWWLLLGAYFFVSENGDKCGTLFFEKNYRRSWEDRLPANENHLIDWKLKGNDRSKSRVKILLKTRERLRHAIQHPDDFLKPRSLKNCDAVLLFSQMSSRILSLSLSLCAIRWVEHVT